MQFWSNVGSQNSFVIKKKKLLEKPRNVQFLGEATDEQDKQWYTHMPVDSTIDDIVQDDTNSVDAHSSSAAPSVQATAQSEFAAFSSRSRHLGRMTSEQALEYFMDRHNARSSQ